MRKLLLIFLLGTTQVLAWGQWKCEFAVSDSIQQLFELEAEQLLLRQLSLEQEDGQYKSIDLPRTELQNIRDGLLAIYGDPSLPHWEDIFERFAIRSTKQYPTRNFKILADKFLAQGLSINGINNFATDSTYLSLAFEKLIQSYDLEALDRQFWVTANSSREQTWVPMRSRRGINVSPLLVELARVRGIFAAVPGDLSTDPSRDISYREFDDSIEYTFHFSWNCDEDKSNCADSHHWRYRVNADLCTVDFVGESGSTLPTEEVSGLLSTGIFPNPTFDRVFVQALGPAGEDIQVILYNAIGQILEQQIVAATSGLIEAEFSLLDYPLGLYFVGLIGPNGQVLTKEILKQ